MYHNPWTRCTDYCSGWVLQDNMHSSDALNLTLTLKDNAVDVRTNKVCLTTRALWTSQSRTVSSGTVSTQLRVECMHHVCAGGTTSQEWSRASGRHTACDLFTMLSRDRPLVQGQHFHKITSCKRQNTPCSQCFHEIMSLSKVTSCKSHNFPYSTNEISTELITYSLQGRVIYSYAHFESPTQIIHILT